MVSDQHLAYAQYILIVWLFNNNRFRDGISPDHWFISFISQQKFLWLYFSICLVLSFAFYGLVEFISHYIAPTYLPSLINDGGWAVVCYQGINFHHYIVDGYIWKVRKKSVAANLGVNVPDSHVKEAIAEVAEG